MKRFQFEEIDSFLGHLNPLEVADIKSKTSQLAPTGFQIWGIPSGAQRVLANMETGDYLMLLESTDFEYCGQIIHRVSELSHDLSSHIWGEQRFPIIIFLQGELISYGWEAFIKDFGFAKNYHMRGNTSNISRERMAGSKYQDEDTFISEVLTTKGANPIDQKTDFHVFAEGLRSHLREVKQREQQFRFRNGLFEACGSVCAFCDLSIPVVLEAAHVVPKNENGTDDLRNGLVLCAVHHRLFDANVVGIDPTTLSIVPQTNWGLDELRITRRSLSHLPAYPHIDALRWRWSRLHRPSNGS